MWWGVQGHKMFEILNGFDKLHLGTLGFDLLVSIHYYVNCSLYPTPQFESWILIF